ncbi:tetratricopeptide repeat protein [Nisaea sediminum]|uniref:hypothetical protein n=1 Tax=Nisaea sediminum TaxID=2775867 RepID=UPI001866F1BE|nr:hypothetical protein [Nisaea sediminum]
MPRDVVPQPVGSALSLPDAQIENLLVHLQNNPRDVEAMKRLGALYAETGELKEAVSAYVSASIERPGDAETERALMDLQARAQQKGKH